MNRHPKVLFTFIPHFPIAVERAVSRSLRDRPIVLAASQSPRAKCLLVSDEARRWGVKRDMSLRSAQQVCRGLYILLPNSELYRRAWNAVTDVVREYSPRYEPARYGQLYLDVTGTRRLFGEPLQIAERIHDRLSLDLKLKSEVGIASNKLVSRVAAFDARVDGLFEVATGSEEPFMAPHHVAVLPAADFEMRIRLVELNITRVKQVREIEFETLIAALGIRALPLPRQARGIDPTPVIAPGEPPRIVLSEELPEDTNEFEYIAAKLRNLAIECVMQLNQKRCSAREMELDIQFSDHRTARNAVRLRHAVSLPSVWIERARDLLIRTLTRRIRVHRIGVCLTNLYPCPEQLNLSLENNEPGLQQQRKDAALTALGKIRAKYGEGALMFADHCCPIQ